ncbi:uncharacterized protein GVI51_J05709 [Nakaseomyces glabratus]|uniref:Uncharacterized protein n=1 Tax=Candida glabrata (strain ATCC 2001 / BCRC 20586 / JCM 3761 / NBRC 0622 / NRRL Y-65 / CBS 138) TaxID=284593 RepID=Q6FP82_CANGA|nr:uncharacterized protein CAGL0J05896g [Nakaseomyces glabratus]KAH7598379.1 GPI-Mannosyltransferase II co-activator [Nakaseomyces glabratus]KAH7603808.1 GPI-Mannosyltransferase II co-activator [Nakaseomyces glabratus]QHS67614.1 uncharacterized protein GVI51_J05709 [Nakaseomyces glabratus]CAG60913.1 unnamed protein product [Nakaseomyces glabratus]|eukprot:XP_447962.1 uncharacterized protein CAGL0J05896g [[Candida] glabrata]
MLLYYTVLPVLWLCAIVSANTETLRIRIPRQFKTSELTRQVHDSYSILKNLEDTAIVSGNINSTSPFHVIEVRSNWSGTTLDVRVSWTAADGYSINDLGYLLITKEHEVVTPWSNETFEGLHEKLYVYFKVVPDSYPLLEDGQVFNVAINIKETFLGLTSDLYVMIAYLIVLASISRLVVVHGWKLLSPLL